MRTRGNVVALSILAGAVAMGAVLALQAAPDVISTPDVVRVLPPADAARMHVTVKPVDPTGLISLHTALVLASTRVKAEQVKPEAFLQLMTDPSSARGPDPIDDRPMWVVRYSGLSVESPGGVELHHAYVVIDARTGVEHHTSWSP